MNKVLSIILISLFSLTVISSCSISDDLVEDSSDDTTTTTDTTAPVIAEVTFVTTPTNDSTPNYTFSSTEAGTITYGGSCSSGTTSATSGNNTITLVSLSEGTYSNCTITVTDSTGNLSNTLTLTSFIVDSTAATLAEVTAVTTSTNNTTPDFTFSSSEAGTITYGGSCSSSTTSVIAGTNTITLNSLSDGTYSNCTITVIDNASNSVTLNIRSFVIDTTPPTVSSISQTDNSTGVSVSTTVEVTFSEAMSTSTITTNTENTTCSGSFQLSSDNFTTCIKMSAAPSASNSDKTFTATPSDNLSRGTNYKLRITTSAKDTYGYSLASDYTTTNGFTTMEAGTIKGSVLSQSSNSTLSGVSVIYTKSGTTIVNTTTDSSGDFSQPLNLGTYTITYSKSGYLDETQSATLATDNQTLVASTLRMLSDNCTSGTISGIIKDAVNNNPVTGVSLSVRRGVNVTSGTIAKTDNTSATGTYSLSDMSAGWYTVETSKSGYITSTFHVYACGDQSGQNTSISTTLDTGAMRIVLSWKETDDLDAHLTGPDNLSGQGHDNRVHEQFHVYWDENDFFYYVTNNYSCSGCSVSQMSDNVTLDLDSGDGKNTGPETITIAAVRSGSYRYYVHNFDAKGINNLQHKLAASDASVKVYYNDNGTTNVTTFNVPNSAGDLWYVFDFDISSGFTAVNNMGSDSSFEADIFAPTISEVTAVTTPTNDNATLSYTFSSNEAGTITYGGSCSSSTTSATTDNNTITFNALADGTYSNCKISVTDSSSNTSDNLSVSSFTIDTTAPKLEQVTAVSTPTNDNTSLSYTFSSTEAGNISYGGSCSSSTNSATAGNNTITFNALAEGTYDNCTISVTDNLSNTSDNLSVSSFTIDTTAPTLDNVTIASNNSDNTTLAKTGNVITFHHLCRSHPNTQRKHCRSGCSSEWW